MPDRETRRPLPAAPTRDDPSAPLRAEEASGETEVLDPTLIAEFLQMQREQTLLAREQVAANERSEERSLQYALAALEQGGKDRDGDRDADRDSATRSERALYVVLAASLSFAAVCLFTGQQALLVEVVKLGAAFGAGGFGFYNIGKSRGARDERENTELREPRERP